MGFIRWCAAALALLALVGAGTASAAAQHQQFAQASRGRERARDPRSTSRHSSRSPNPATGNRLSGTPGYDDVGPVRGRSHGGRRLRRRDPGVPVRPARARRLEPADPVDRGRRRASSPGIIGGEGGGDFGSAFSPNTKQADLTSPGVRGRSAAAHARGGRREHERLSRATTSPACRRAPSRSSSAAPATFVMKQENAERLADAGAVIVFNDGLPTRDRGCLDVTRRVRTIPVFDAATRVGQALANGVEQGLTGPERARADRLAPGHLHHEQRDRGDARRRREQRGRRGRPPRQRRDRGRASTTTARALSAILEIAEAMANTKTSATRCASCGSAPRSRVCSARRIYVEEPERRPSARRSRRC